MPRILLVDDDPTVLELEKLILYEAGYEFLDTQNPLAAYELLQYYDIDLVIADIEMPRMNGFQFISGLRKQPQFENLPVAFLTASMNEKNIAHAAKLKADFYVVKPLVKKDFLDKIGGFFSKRRAQNPVKHQESYQAKEHLKVNFEEPLTAQVKIHKNIEVVSISETGAEIMIDQRLESGQVIELPPSVFYPALDECPLMKVSTVKEIDKGRTRALLVFMYPSLEVVRKVQRLIAVKNQPAENLKYPKMRG